jgi:hypothetical protein
MMALNNPVVIEKITDTFPLTFEFLRRHGIAYAQQFSGSRWTDYNLHDPGVTILEQLCFALTDLSYRTDFPIQDLLAREDGSISREDNLFIAREQVLTTKPVSVNDYRKYAMDKVPEIRNVWIDQQASAYTHNYARGVYSTIIQIDEDAYEGQDAEALEASVEARVLDCLSSVRNICEDFEKIISLKQQEIVIKADILITDDVSAEEIMARIYLSLKNALNPPLQYYTEKELVAKGMRTEDIYDGPLLKNGIIPDSEMRRRRKEINPSDLVNALSAIKGVESVRNVWLESKGNIYYNQPLTLAAYHYPVIKKENFCAGIKMMRDKFNVHVREDRFLHFYHKIKEQSKREYVASLHEEEKHDTLTGRYRNPGRYYSMQDHFPVIYGLGHDSMQQHQAVSEQAKVRQLKAYLMLFEQVLANYLAQLQHLPQLYAPAVSEKSHTYFYQPLYAVPGIADMLRSFTGLYKNKVYGSNEWKRFVEDGNNDYIKHLRTIIETDEVFRKRKNAMLDHLLARFNLSLTGYGATLYNLYYNGAEASRKTEITLAWKAAALRNINVILYSRSRARQNDGTRADLTAETSFEQNIYFFLYIRNDCGKRLYTPPSGAEVKMSKSNIGSGRKDPELITLLTEAGEIVVANDMMPANNSLPVFSNQPLSFLQRGLSEKNYRVVPDPAEKGKFLLLYKASPQYWKIIGRYDDEHIAYRMTDEAIKAIKKTSLDAEGFHLAEHILLRPSPDETVFGFRFVVQGKNKERVLFSQKKWLSFKQREQAIGQLLKAAAKSKAENNNITLQLALEEWCSWQKGIPTEKETAALVDQVKYSLNLYSNKRNELYPAFRFHVRITTDITIGEEFYDYRMTAVFPAWPARFQDTGFRSFAENVIKEYSPAHIYSSIQWLNMQDMQGFEDYFFAWKESRNGTDTYKTAIAREKLTVYLAKEHFIVYPE